MFKKITAFALLFSAFFSLIAQTTYRQLDILKTYKEAEELINLGKYAVAQPYLEDFIQKYENKTLDKSNLIFADAVFYKALCEKETSNPAAEKDLLFFAENFKGHPKTNSAYFHLGDLAYASGNYNDALAWFDKVDERALSGKDLQQFQYKRAFTYFTLKKFQQARMYFNQFANNKKHPYYEEANYYSGLSSYYLKDYNAAYKSFQLLEDSKKYGKAVPYYILSIKFINKDYKTVISYGEAKLKENVNYSNEIAHLIGNAAFELQDYDKAVYYLEQYTQNAAKVTPEDYYTLGYVQAQRNQCDKAIKNLEQLSPVSESALGQNAMYLLAQCYEKSGKKDEARTAFLQAARQNFDKTIQEEAWFQYCKLSYELGYTNDALVGLKNFLTSYPKSKYTQEANELLADLFLMTRNYEEAMSIIESLPNKSAKMQETYQKMAYFRAIESYNDFKFDKAETFFDKSLIYTPNKGMEALAYYWKADMAYQQNNYDKSMMLLNKFLPLSSSVTSTLSTSVNAGTGNYLYGYNFYKQKDYPNAAPYFQKAVNALKNDNGTLKQTVYPDAAVRLADCYYMQKQYKYASQYYDEIIKANMQGADYALYQKSIIDGLGGNYQDKIAGMKALVARFPNSAFYDDAMMQTGNTYMALDKDADAIATFKSLIQTKPNSDQVPEAYLKLGLIYFNQDNYDESLSWYQKVVQQYPRTPASNEAMLAIKEIYIAKGDPNGYITFANKYPDSKVTASEQDSLLYLSAEGQFYKGDMDKALQGFENYLLQFPNGYFALQANFYRSECYFSKQEFAKALTGYEYVLRQSQNRFTERSLARAANINYFDLKNYQSAYDLYTKLLPAATLDENKRESVIGLMRTSYYLKKYQECLDNITKVSALPALPEFYKAEMAYYKGMSYYNLNNKDDKAITELNYVVKNANNEQAAESKYTIAKIYFNKGNKKQSEKECNEYLDKYPSYEYYLAKTFILLSDIYLSDNKTLQAKATLQSLLDNYTTQDEVRAEAQQKLDLILAKEMDGSKLKLQDNSPVMKFDEGK